MIRIILGALCLVGTLGLTTLPANAQATRTWVSGVGDDANPCSRTAPCKTFAGAISKTATGGEINCIDPGGFGAVTITKSITIDCEGTFGSILHSGTNGVIINPTGACNVVLRNLSINGAGTTLGLNGIRILAPCKVVLENLEIFNSSNAGIDAEPTTGTLKLDVSNTTVHHNGAGGILLKPAASAFVLASLREVRMYQNTGFGVRAEDRVKSYVLQSVASNNGTSGFDATSISGGFAEIDVVGSMSSSNATGFNVSGAAGIIRLLQSSAFNNTTGLANAGGQILGTTPDTNMISGNTTDGAVTGNVGLQ